MKTDLGRSAAILTAAKIITALIAMVSSMLLSRFRTLTEYGTYSQILIVVTLACTFFMLGLPNSTNYFLALAETHEEKRHFLSTYYTLNTTLCVIMGVVLAICVPLIESYYNNELIGEFVFVLVILPWTRVIIGSISNVLVVYGQTERLTLFNVINALVALAAILLTKLFNGSFTDYLRVYVLGETAMSVCVYVTVWKLESPLGICFDTALIKRILKYSVPIGMASLVGTVSIEIDKLMIGRIFDTAHLAIYTNASKSLPFAIVASSLTAVLLPQMTRMLKAKDAKGAVELWGCSIRLSYIIICFCATSLIVFAPQVMTVLYSEKYLPGVSIFRVYSLVLILRCTYFGIVLNSTGKTKLILYSSIASLLLNIVLNFALYRLFGMIGPAIATFMCVLSVNMLQLVFSSKELNISFSRIFPWKKLLEISVVNICWGVLAGFVIRQLGLMTTNRDIVFAVIIGIIFACIYFAVMLKPIKKLWKQLNG